MAKPATAEALQSDAPPKFELVPVDRLVESHLNHRKQSWGDMKELTESVRAKGVLQPILVRPLAGIGANKLEVVFGHRRVRAAREAGLVEVPAVIRELSDVDAMEANVIENLQRADVHPLEEAEGYEQLLAQQERPLTVEDLAAKVGKSKAYLYGRLKLLALIPEARKAFFDGKITPSVALLVARVPASLQKAALGEVTHGRYGDGDEPMGFRWAAEAIQRRFMLDLKRASFDRADAGLVPSAGPCGTCPKRTGANPDLFGDVGSADVCTDPDCYREKLDAWWTRQAAGARAAGRPVLAAKEAKEAFEGGGGGGNVRYSSPYVNLDAYHPSDPKRRTYGKLLGKRVAEAAVLAQAPNGETIQLLPKKALPKLLRDAGHDFKAERAEQRTGMTPEEREAAKRATEKREVAFKVGEQLRGLIGNALDVTPLTREFWDAAIDVLLSDYGHQLDEVFERRGLGDAVSFAKKRKAMSDDGLRAICLEGAILSALNDGAGKDIARLAAWARIDVKAVEKQVKADRAAAPAKAKKGGRRG